MVPGVRSHLGARLLRRGLAVFISAWAVCAGAETGRQVVDVPTRPGVTERVLVLTPPEAKAVVVLLAGGHGGLRMRTDGSMSWGEGNFLVRTRQLFADQGLEVAVLDAPSDHQSSPFLAGFRQTADHVADLRAVLAWLRAQSHLPVWLVGTSRGTQSAAYVATELPLPDGPDGVVLTSTILRDPKGRAVPAMPLERIRVPVLVVHHEQDGCALCPASALPALMSALSGSARTELITFRGGQDRGDPCEAFAHHGYNGLEADVVARIAAWILAH